MTKVNKKPTAKELGQAAERNEAGLKLYAEWQIDQAAAAFQEAIAVDPDNPEYHLNLARAYVRAGSYDKAMRSLGEFLRTETDDDISTRYERLFSSALDEVEQKLIDGMRQLDLPIQQVGKGIQMWLEYRITIGRRPLRIAKPERWAAALTLAISKINFAELKRSEIAAHYGVSARSLKEKYDELVETLDLMPADYRYFTGESNPLDRLIEAAQMLDEIYRSFRED